MGESAKQARASVMRSEASRRGDRLIEFFKFRVFIVLRFSVEDGIVHFVLTETPGTVDVFFFCPGFNALPPLGSSIDYLGANLKSLIASDYCRHPRLGDTRVANGHDPAMAVSPRNLSRPISGTHIQCVLAPRATLKCAFYKDISKVSAQAA